MISGKIYLLTITMLVLTLSAAGFSSERKYTGNKVCAPCHKGEKNKNVHEIWVKSAHSRAFETLKSEESKKIAKQKGIDSPEKSDECLVCHVTNGGKGVGIKVEEGVSCEACHGPGSDYKSKSVMANREEAVKKGLILGKDDAELCKKCHNTKSPTYKSFAYEKEWKKIAHPTK